jgi:hypothetical protein
MKVVCEEMGFLFGACVTLLAIFSKTCKHGHPKPMTAREFTRSDIYAALVTHEENT